MSTAPALKRRHTNSSSSHDNPSHVPIHNNSTTGAQEQQEKRMTKCLISDEAFAVPQGYRNPRQQRVGTLADEEEELLQMAIRQSLLDYSPSDDTTTTTGGQHETLQDEVHKCLITSFRIWSQ